MTHGDGTLGGSWHPRAPALLSHWHPAPHHFMGTPPLLGTPGPRDRGTWGAPMVMGVPCGHRGHLRVFGGGCGQWGASGTVGGMGHTGDIWWHWGTAARMGCDPPVRRRQHPGLAWVPPQPAWVPPPSAGRSLPAPPCLAALITTPLLITSPSPAPTTSTLTTSPHPPGHPWEPQPRLPALPPPTPAHSHGDEAGNGGAKAVKDEAHGEGHKVVHEGADGEDQGELLILPAAVCGAAVSGDAGTGTVGTWGPAGHQDSSDSEDTGMVTVETWAQG